MKRFTVLLALFVLLMIPGRSESASINIISQNCYANSIYFENGEPYEFIDSGLNVANTPFASAYINVGDSTLNLAATTGDWYAYSYAEILFRPIGASGIKISADVYAYESLDQEVELIDLTDDVRLFYIFPSHKTFNTYYDEISNFLIPLTSTHTYSLKVNSAYYSGSAQANISFVPEPATMLLLGLGLIGLAGIRRKFMQ